MGMRSGRRFLRRRKTENRAPEGPGDVSLGLQPWGWFGRGAALKERQGKASPLKMARPDSVVFSWHVAIQPPRPGLKPWLTFRRYCRSTEPKTENRQPKNGRYNSRSNRSGYCSGRSFGCLNNSLISSLIARLRLMPLGGIGDRNHF